MLQFMHQVFWRRPKEQVVAQPNKKISWTWRSLFPQRHHQQPHWCVCTGPIFVRCGDHSYRCDFCNGLQRRDGDGPSFSQSSREKGRIFLTPGLAFTEAARNARWALLTHFAAAHTSLAALAARTRIAWMVSQRSWESYTEWCTRVRDSKESPTSGRNTIAPLSSATRCDQQETLEEAVQNALYGLRFAVASYALPYELGYFDGLGRGLRLWMPSHHRYVRASTADQVNAIRRILCGERDDPLLEVAYARYSASLWQPCFVVILDHHTQRVVISFRGTLSAADLIADLAGGYRNVHLTTYRDTTTGKMEELCTQVPSGFYTNVMEAGTHLTQVLNIIREQYPNYKLLCVGHSLGAVEAILFHLMFLFPTQHENNNNNNNNTVHTIAFGPAPCVEQTVVEKISALMGPRALTSWVNRLDAVPRLQARSIYSLFYPSSSSSSSNINTNTSNNVNTSNGNSANDNSMEVPLLAVPGRLLHVPDGTKSVVEVPLDAPWRQQLVLGRQMLQDHLPLAYTEAIYRVRAELEGHKGERSEKKEMR